MAEQTHPSPAACRLTVLQVGQCLKGRYLVTRHLAQGGFSETYLAEDIKYSERSTYVVKHLNPLAANEAIAPDDVRHRFHQEAETLKVLGHHDQIPQLLDCFDEDGNYYLVQEWIDGRSLHTELATSHPWSHQQVIVFLQEILTVLAFVHQHGFIHRDVKPENILRRRSDQRLVLIDFGSVKQVLLAPSTVIKTSNSIEAATAKDSTVAVFSQGYTPVEQRAGYPCLASDIYAVGMVAIQAWTGQHPQDFEGIAFTETDWWVERSQTHPVLAGILEKMTHQDWQERYQHVAEILQVIAPWQDSPSVEAPKYTPTQILQPDQHPHLAITIPALKLPATDLGDCPPESHQVPKIPTEAITITRDSNLHDNFVNVQFLKSRVNQGFRHAIQHISTHYSARTVSMGIAICMISSGLMFFLWILYGVIVSTQRDASREQANTAMAPPLLNTFNGTSPIQAIALDSKHNILFSGNADKTISMWDLTSGNVVQVLDDHFRSVTALAISVNTNRLASGSDDANIKIWNTSTGEHMQTLRGHQWSVSALTFATDGKTLISSGQDNTIRHWDAETGRFLGIFSEVQSPVLALDTSVDGSLLVAGSEDNTVQVWNLYTRELLMTLRGHAAPVHAIAISLNGAIAVSGSSDQTANVWNLYTGKLLQTLNGHMGEIHTVAISPDGRMVATGGSDGLVNVWNLYSGERLYTLKRVSGTIHGLAFSSNGLSLIGVSSNGVINLWQIPSLISLQHESGSVVPVAQPADRVTQDRILRVR